MICMRDVKQIYIYLYIIRITLSSFGNTEEAELAGAWGQPRDWLVVPFISRGFWSVKWRFISLRSPPSPPPLPRTNSVPRVSLLFLFNAWEKLSEGEEISGNVAKSRTEVLGRINARYCTRCINRLLSWKKRKWKRGGACNSSWCNYILIF